MIVDWRRGSHPDEPTLSGSMVRLAPELVTSVTVSTPRGNGVAKNLPTSGTRRPAAITPVASAGTYPYA